MNPEIPHQQQRHLPQPFPAQAAPAHHRPPAVEYRDGVPYHYTIGQQPQQIVVQLPETASMSPAQRELVVNVVLLLVVAVVLCGCVIGLVVIAGGTLMGLIGTIGANAVPVGLTAVGAIVAAGWLVTKLKGLAQTAVEDKK
ncbi:MAG TPA: hypothetical protein VN520_14305 [Streptomyces sp.]|uniref:hypothetical protein n=1 Tax=Streptomyces sp. TaxID=1931 RepID=UPI002B6C5BBB|nr:hypothetical protein [Streptomyces sp.]HWU07530.1 hypothetical protein [Streptomyces sp.]